MSVINEHCPKCGEETEIVAFSNHPDILMCCACNFKGNRGAFEAFIPILFDRITKSVDTLAVEFVGMMFDRVAYEYRYYSMLTGEFYNSEEAAIAATVAKLKEVEK